MQARLPSRFEDISSIRPVPDHQEVWGDGVTDQSVIVEVAERILAGDEAVGQVVFEDLIALNDATNSTLSAVRQLDPSELPHLPHSSYGYACVASGTLRAAKSGEGPEGANDVAALVAVVRLPRHATDLLVTVSALQQQAGGGGDSPAPADARLAADDIMRGVLQSLRIDDWGLFSADGG